MTDIQAKRTRDYSGPVTNTDIWGEFALRSDDVIVGTPPKCGTTWMLSIVMMLIYQRALPDAGSYQHAPWLDCAFRDRKVAAEFLRKLDRRRCIKSHTPMDGILYAREPTYVVVYRHPVDMHFSFRTHVENMKDDSLDYMFPEDEREGFRRFVDAPLSDAGTDDLTVASFVHHYLQAKTRAVNGNVHFFHYADMSRDLSGQISRLAKILGISISEQLLGEITEATSFDSMRKAAETSERRFAEDTPFHDLAGFFASGSSNKWEARLRDSDMDLYRSRIASLLNAEDVAWLEYGGVR